MGVDVAALQELPETHEGLREQEWCCFCGPLSISTIATCFGCTVTR
jgi:hypothetical protein